MATTSGMPASMASSMADAANDGGTKTTVASAPVWRMPSATLLNTGSPSCVVPALFGLTPPTILVPYAKHCFAWNVPWAPVKPVE